MKQQLLILLVVTLLTGCRPILMKIYGIKKPSIENEASIKKKASKFDLDTSNIATLNSKDFLSTLSKSGIPEASIYDKDGRYIEYRQSDTSCNAGLFQFIPALNLTSIYNQPDSAELNTELIKFRDLAGRNLSPPEEADFYLLIYWSIWTGRFNKSHIKIWEDLAQENKNCKIKVIKVNLDIQEYWEEQEREEIISAFSKMK